MAKLNTIVGADYHLANDLALSIINDTSALNQIEYMWRSLARKVKRGVYDPVLAGKAWRYTIEGYIPTYKRDAGFTGRIDVPTRNLAGRLLEQVQREQVYITAGVPEPTFPEVDTELKRAELEG